MQLLAHPFRLTGGRAATVTDGSDAALADAVARIVLTRPGELELVPAYGIPDPLWEPSASAGAVDVARVNAVLATFGPSATVTLASLTRSGPSASTEHVNLEVTRS